MLNRPETSPMLSPIQPPHLSSTVCLPSLVTFNDCKGNEKLHYEVSSPHFKVNSDGTLVALRNITAVGRTLFVHARTPHAEDMAELVIVGGKDIQGSLQVTRLPGHELQEQRYLLYHVGDEGLLFCSGVFMVLLALL